MLYLLQIKPFKECLSVVFVLLYTNVDCCWRQNKKKHRRNADAFSVWNYSNLFH